VIARSARWPVAGERCDSAVAPSQQALLGISAKANTESSGRCDFGAGGNIVDDNTQQSANGHCAVNPRVE